MSGPYPDRRELLAASAAMLGASAVTGQPQPPRGKKYPFKKSINLWAFPYPEKMIARAVPASSPRTPASTASS